MVNVGTKSWNLGKGILIEELAGKMGEDVGVNLRISFSSLNYSFSQFIQRTLVVTAKEMTVTLRLGWVGL